MKNFCSAAAILSIAVFTCVGQVPPANDNYTNAIALAGNDLSFSGALAGATRETNLNEIVASPLTGSANQSVWWRWTPAQSSMVIIQILSCSKDTFRNDEMEVYNLQSINTGQVVAGMAIDSGMPHLVFSFPAQAGTNYHIQLAGSDSANFTFRLIATNWPFVIEQPRSQTISDGDSVLLTVAASGLKPFGYQWQCNGTNLDGETAPMLCLDHVATNQAGRYSVAITNPSGATISDAANLMVTPADTAAILMAVKPSSAGQFGFALLGETGRRYRIQSSTNFSGWAAEASFPTLFREGFSGQMVSKSVVFDSTGADSFFVSRIGPRRFFRSICFHAANEVCNNHLKALRFAQLLFAYDQGGSGGTGVGFGDLRPYFKNGDLPICPAFGTESLTTIMTDPECTLHPFEEP